MSNTTNGRGRDQYDDLDALIDALISGRSPDAGDDPELTSLLETVRALLQAGDEPELPAGDFPARLADRLFQSLATSTSNAHRPDERVPASGTDTWNTPALDISARRRDQASQRPEPEETRIMSDLVTTQEAPTPLTRPRWRREALKLAAAIAIFALVGAVLVLLLRNNDNEPTVAAPVSTATTLASPSSDATATVELTATIEPTRQAAITKLTATAEAHASAATATADTAATANASLPPTGDVVAEIPIGTAAAGMARGTDAAAVAATDNAIWVANASEGTVLRVDPATNAVVATVRIGPKGGSGSSGSPKFLSAYAGQVWTINNVDGTIVQIDPATNQVVHEFPLSIAGGSDDYPGHMLVVDETGIWVTDGAGSRLSHFDPATGSVLSSIDISFPLSIASGFGSIWVMTVDRGADDGPYALVRIDPATSEIVSRLSLASVESSVEPWFVATGAGSVWVSDWSSSTIIRVAPTTNTIVATIDTRLGTGHAILALPSGVWVSSVFSSGVVRIDPTTNQAGQIISKENGHGAGLTELDGTIWASQDTGVVRIEPAP